jgi:hypothetical protein
VLPAFRRFPPLYTNHYYLDFLVILSATRVVAANKQQGWEKGLRSSGGPLEMVVSLKIIELL